MDNVEGLAVDIAAVQLVLAGKFDKKIAELKELRASINEKDGIRQTVKEAEKLAAEAAKTKAEADKYAAEVASKDAALNKAQSELATFSASLAAKESAVSSAEKSASEILQKAQRVAVDSERAMTEREAQLAKDREQVDAGFANLEAQRKAFNAKLAALQA